MWFVSSGCDENRDLPEEYRQLLMPARIGSKAASDNGRRLFLNYCAICHGERADGRGQRSAAFDRPPADFTKPGWRGRQTPRRLFVTVREGVRGTAMPAWKATLSDDETWDLVAYVLSVAGKQE